MREVHCGSGGGGSGVDAAAAASDETMTAVVVVVVMVDPVSAQLHQLRLRQQVGTVWSAVFLPPGQFVVMAVVVAESGRFHHCR